MKKIDSKIQNKKKQQKQNKIADCRFNGEVVASNDDGKVSLRIAELGVYLLVDPSKIDTEAKKDAYIENYINNVNDSLKRFADLF